MDVACDLTIRFTADGNSLAYLGGGWARAEPAFTWSVGAESHVILPRPKGGGEYILTLDVGPFIRHPDVPAQRLIVSVNDTVLGEATLSRRALLGYRISGAIASGAERMLVTLRHPDSARPNQFPGSEDDRDLAFAVWEAKLYQVLERAGEQRLPEGLMLRPGAGTGDKVDLVEWAGARSGLSLHDLAIRFESIGESCEFGLFQRRCDAEPLGLLRFSSTFLRNLIRGIETEFAGLGEIDAIDPRLEGAARKEFMIHERTYGLVYHTFVYEGERSVWLVREQEAARLKFLRRKFLEELRASEKIFVYCFSGPVSEEEIMPLHMALNRHGPSTLLWVVRAEHDWQAGAVEVLGPGLLKGYIDRFARDGNAHDLSFDGWLAVCANAWALERLRRRGAAMNGPEQAGDDPNPGGDEEERSC